MGEKLAAGNKLRLLYIIPTLNTGGAEKYVLEIASKLSTQGHQTYVVSLGPIDEEFLDLHGSRNTQITQFQTKKVISIRSLWVIYRLFKYLKEERIDLVHLNLIGADILGGIAALLAGCPFISTQHNTRSWRYSRKLRKRLAKLLHRSVMHFSSAIIAPTLSVKQYLRETTQIPLCKIRVIYHGIDLNKFAPRIKKIRRRVTIGSIGRFEQRKGQMYIVDALPKILSKLKKYKIEVLFAGEGVYQHKVKSRAVQLDLLNYVKFLGTLKDMPDFLSKIHILAHAATEGEAFCYAALEGLATGKAVVITNTDGIPEFIKDHHNGILIPIRSSEAVANAIIELIENQREYDIISKNAANSVRPFFSKDRTIDETLQLYTETLRKEKTD